MDFLHYIKVAVDILNWIALNAPWEAIIASGVLSGLLVGPQKLVKKLFEHNEQVMILIVGCAGLLVAGGNYLLHTPTQEPTIVALQGLALAFGSQPFYFIIVKPLSKRASVWFAARVAEASLIREARAAAALEVAPTPAPAPVPVADVVAPSSPSALHRSIDVQTFDR